jgi:glycine/D-amino acid oxidase-like deaminating enzyme
MNVANDTSCSWINDLDRRSNIKTLDKDKSCDWLIVGAGYTGLSAARKLSELHSNQKIVIVDAQLAGEGASGRNSGYLVDTTLNDGFTSNKELSNYKKKTDIYKLENFSKTLSKLDFEHDILEKDDLSKRLGTNFYNLALYTKGGVLLHPGKLVRAMVDTLPNNVELLENSQLNEWAKNTDTIICKFNIHKIITKKIIFCTNGFLKSLGIKDNYNFPLTLTASMTRSLTDGEYKSIGEPKEWGVLPVRPMGATIRMTTDKRILIRNTAEVHNPFKMSKSDLDKRSLTQKLGIKKRFPNLADDIIESSWSGIVSRTRNSSQIFDKIDNNVFIAGCYNGSGIGVGTLFGEQIAIKASNENSDEINTIESRSKPTWLPPQPFLNIGVKTRLIFERFRSRSDV